MFKEWDKDYWKVLRVFFVNQLRLLFSVNTSSKTMKFREHNVEEWVVLRKALERASSEWSHDPCQVGFLLPY